jgi:hypothetical protein
MEANLRCTFCLSQCTSSGGIGLPANVGSSDYLSGVTGQTLSSAGLYAGSGVASGGSTAAAGALGGLQGTPGLGGAFGGGQPVDITDLPGTTGAINTAGGDIKSGSSAIQSGAQNAVTGLAGTLTSAVNSLESYTSSAFVTVAIVATGAIVMAFGLGLFNKKSFQIPIIGKA